MSFKNKNHNEKTQQIKQKLQKTKYNNKYNKKQPKTNKHLPAITGLFLGTEGNETQEKKENDSHVTS